MRRPLSQRSGPFLAAALLLLAATIFADVMVADLGRSSLTHGGPHEIQATRVVEISTIKAEPGARIVVHPHAGAPSELVDTYDFYIVEHGEGRAFLTNGTPEHVYASVQGMRPDVFEDRPVVVTRPASPHPVPGPGLDLVWIFHLAPGVERPTQPQAAEYWEKWVRSSTHGTTATVQSAGAMRLHAVAQPMIWLLSVAVLAAGFLWLRGVLPSPRPPARDDEAETGLRLVEAGGRYLRTLRGLLLGAFLPFLFLAWSTLFFVWGALSEHAGLEGSWGVTLRTGVWIVLGSVLVGWTVLTWRADRAYRRWRARAPPRLV